MKFKGFLLIALLFGLFACGNKSGGNNQASSEAAAPAEKKMEKPGSTVMRPTPQKTFTKMFDAGSYTLTAQSQNGERSKVTITTKGLQNEYNETMEIEAQVLQGYMLDINGDGNKEFVFTLLPTDDSGNIDIMAFTALGDRSIIQMYVKEPTLLRTMNTDKVEVKGNQVIRTFMSGGQSHRFTYEMVPGEAAISLVAKEG